MNTPRIVIAATHSGAGKTTITLGIILALKKRGYTVQAFKTGPDYIDPGFHTLAAGRPARNLDTVLIPGENIIETYLHGVESRGSESADFAVIEGVMGLYDGFSGGDERGSTAHLSKILDAPILLCIDASAAARSAGAMALGFKQFDRNVRLAGFILNNIGGPSHFAVTRQAIEAATGLPVLGFLPKNRGITLPERHLGLVPAWEREGLPESAGVLVSAVEEHIDVDRVIDIAGKAPALAPGEERGRAAEPPAGRKIFQKAVKKSDTPAVRIGYALDDAFHFYYQNNLDLLSGRGGELVPFSPMRDPELPEGISGVYIGGGYPEIFAEQLQGNRSMRQAIADAAREGLPVYAECGGLMYLMERIITFDGGAFEMAGLFTGQVKMEKKLSALGYYYGRARADSVIARKGWGLWGHLFHWSTLEGVAEDQEYAFSLEKPGREPIADGLRFKNVVAGYFHIHFAGGPHWADRFLENCRNFGGMMK